MVAVDKFPAKYINECRSKIAEHISAYQDLVAAAEKAGSDQTRFKAVVAAFEPHFFNNLVLAMDGYFVHRTRALEKQDGNPLNEVRILCNSMMTNNNKMFLDKTIEFDPAKSILKYREGDEIKLNQDDFARLSSAFFAEIEDKYL